MKVEIIRPNGFCHGVVTAIRKVLETTESTPGKIYVLGYIIHNEIVVNELEKQGVITIDEKGISRLELLDRIENGTVIFTAHGVSDKVRQKANEKGLNIVDASCKDVTKTQTIIREHLQNGYEVIYVGKNGHPETEGCIGLDDRIKLVTSVADVKHLKLDSKKIIITNQTTLSILDIQETIDAIMSRYPQATFFNEICKATEMRQRAVIDASDADLIIVVGDKRSNNTSKLVELGNNKAKVETIRISSLRELDINLLMGKKFVKVTAGASTPALTIKQVVDFIELFDQDDPTTHEKPEDVCDVLSMYNKKRR